MLQHEKMIYQLMPQVELDTGVCVLERIPLGWLVVTRVSNTWVRRNGTSYKVNIVYHGNDFDHGLFQLGPCRGIIKH